MKTLKFLFTITALAIMVLAARAATMNDAQIAAIVIAANQADIEGGKVAQAQASNQEVKNFGIQMIADHTAMNKETSELLKKLKLEPEDSDTSRMMKKESEENLAKLKSLKGAAFDKAYIDDEVTTHQKVLETVDQLIPDAKNAELKALLVKARPILETHLVHAKRLQASIGG